MLLSVGVVLYLATGQLEYGLEVRINYERYFSTILILVEFDLRLFGALRRQHMEHRHEVVAGAKLFVSRINILR